MKIVRLDTVPELHSAVADLMQQTWPSYYGPEGPGHADQTVAIRSTAGGVAKGIAAIADGHVIGTGGIEETSFGAQAQEGPWLVGLAVAPAWRRQGIAAALITELEILARSSGQIWTTTQAITLFHRRGWVNQRVVADAGRAWQVLRKTLA